MNHNDAIRLFAKTLQNLERWMDKASAHAQTVRAPGFDAHHFVPGAPGERAGVTSNAHLGLVVGLQEKRGHGGPLQLTVLPLLVDRSPSGQEARLNVRVAVATGSTRWPGPATGLGRAERVRLLEGGRAAVTHGYR